MKKINNPSLSTYTIHMYVPSLYVGVYAYVCDAEECGEAEELRDQYLQLHVF